jgi:hypothetical protein
MLSKSKDAENLANGEFWTNPPGTDEEGTLRQVKGPVRSSSIRSASMPMALW